MADNFCQDPLARSTTVAVRGNPISVSTKLTRPLIRPRCFRPRIIIIAAAMKPNVAGLWREDKPRIFTGRGRRWLAKRDTSKNRSTEKEKV